MKLNVFITAIVLFTVIFIITACPSPQNVEISQNTQANQNTPVNQNAEVNQNTQVSPNNSNANNNSSNQNLTLPFNMVLPPNANVRSKPSNTAKTEPKETKTEPTTVTLQNYNKIRVGMTYEEVVGILGSKGESLSEDIPVAGGKSGLYRWSARNGEISISGLFKDGKLLTKTQFGLQ